MAQVVMTIDDNSEHAGAIEKHIKQIMALDSLRVTSGEEALRSMLSGSASLPDVVLLSCEKRHAPLEVLRALRSFRSDVQVILLATHATIDVAEAALSCGAAEFLLMPFHPAQLTAAIRNALLRRDLQIEARQGWAAERFSLEAFSPRSAALSATVFLARKLVDASAPILLEGAPGTGRELLARAMHGSSSRHEEPFITLNASVYHGERAMDELFGDKNQTGLMHKVRGGTLLLRHVDCLPQAVYNRLLPVIKGNEPIHEARSEERFKGRVMFVVNDAARRSSSNERKEINLLFSQLNVLPVSIPYLRDVPEDIPFLAQMHCRRFAAIEGKDILGISGDAKQMLREISWPGNMEQLAQAIFNAVMCCEGNELQVSDFRYLFRPQNASLVHFPSPEGTRAASEGDAESAMRPYMDESGNIKRLQDVEQELIRYALERYSGHMSEVARHLGIGRSTLYRKVSSMDER